MADFELAVKEVFRFEGGYSNDPDDPGGETNHGITIAVARSAGYMRSMKDLTKDEAKEIYKKQYWDTLRLDSVNSQGIALELFDTGVNMGISIPQIFVQKTLNVFNNVGKRWPDIIADGKLGPRTIEMINRATQNKKIEECMIKSLNCKQGNRYEEIVEKRESSEKYMLGWYSHRIKI